MLIVILSALFAFLLAPPAEPVKQDIFPLDVKHNHASAIVELPNGDLMACWYRGSGERTADDVQVLGARLKKGAKAWSEPFVLADQPGFPDTNPVLWVDRDKRLWLFWQTIVANRWETAINNYRVTSRWQGAGAPQWDRGDILLIKPVRIAEKMEEFGASIPEQYRKRWAQNVEHAKDNYFARMGWMTRAHPYQLPSGRILVPLYSDGYSVSLVGISDDGGLTWHASEPIVGGGNIQPSFALRKDGTLLAYMRDNGPPPKRVHVAESKDDGETWTFARDSEMANSGTGLEVQVLKDGRWLMINNDTESGRWRLTLSLSDDEGRTWKWSRALEIDERTDGARMSFHYPSIIQGANGKIHACYSVFLNHLKDGQPRKTIRHASFDADWVKGGQ